jgi:spore germination cell wall hydrolase CwlJ-like protein
VERYVSAISEVIHPGRLAATRVDQRRSRLHLPLLAGICVVAATTAALREDTAEADGSPIESRSAPPAAGLSPPKVEPVRLVEVTPAEAIRLNAEAPTVEVGPAAKPFRARLGTGEGARALTCLAQAVHYEAAVEAVEGQKAVAQVVLNRVRNPAFPSTVCGVVFQGAERSTGCQFSFTCDGSLRRRPSAASWARATAVAAAALNGAVFAPVGNATHYHANYVLPYWASSLDRLTRIGAHIFYRWAGFWGRPSAFRQAYRGVELDTTPYMAAWNGQGTPATLALASDVDAMIDGLPTADLLVDGSVGSARLHSAAGALRNELDAPSQLREAGSPGTLTADREAGVLAIDAEARSRAERGSAASRAPGRQASRTPTRGVVDVVDRAGTSATSTRL